MQKAEAICLDNAIIHFGRGAESGKNSLRDYDYGSSQGAAKLRESVKSSCSSHSK